MSIVNCLTPARKIVFGIFLLICVNFLWVLSSEVSHVSYFYSLKFSDCALIRENYFSGAVLVYLCN